MRKTAKNTAHIIIEDDYALSEIVDIRSGNFTVIYIKHYYAILINIHARIYTLATIARKINLLARYVV